MNLFRFNWECERTDSFIWSVEVKVYNVADSFLQHDFLVIWVHEAHKLWVFQGVQQQLSNPCLVFLGCHVHYIVPAALLNINHRGTTEWVRNPF